MKLANLPVALAAFALSGAASAAIVVNGIDDDFTINWSQAVAQGSTSGTLSATADFDVLSIQDGEATFRVTIANTTTGNFTNAGINSFSFLTDPTSTGSFVQVGSVFDGISSGSVPSFTNHNVCVYAANNCNGGGQGGLLAINATDTFDIKLTWVGGSAITFADGTGQTANWGIKFQTSIGSYEFPGTPGDDDDVPGELPIPGGLALFGIGALGLGAMIRRRRTS